MHDHSLEISSKVSTLYSLSAVLIPCCRACAHNKQNTHKAWEQFKSRSTRSLLHAHTDQLNNMPATYSSGQLSLLRATAELAETHTSFQQSTRGFCTELSPSLKSKGSRLPQHGPALVRMNAAWAAPEAVRQQWPLHPKWSSTSASAGTSCSRTAPHPSAGLPFGQDHWWRMRGCAAVWPATSVYAMSPPI